MRIRELDITNYRPFSQNVNFEFRENLTVIAGVNGKGKTAILEALALILSRLLPKIAPARSGFRKISNLDVHENQDATKISIKCNCANIPLDFSLTYRKDTGEIDLTRLAPAVRTAIRNGYGDPNRADDQAPLVVYYTTDRAGYRFPKSLPQVVPSGQAMAYNGALFNRTVDYRDFMARFRVLSAQLSTGQFSATTIAAINRAISSFLDGFSNLQFVDNPPRLLIKKRREVLDIRQLSDGERSFIALICDLTRRLALANPELENPLLGAGVVLIDEIELHLHPKWQLEVAEKLRTTFPNIQFIVTTHSPFIIQTAREGEVLKLDGDLVVDPHGKSIEEIAKYVMDVENSAYSPRITKMKDIALEYMRLVEESKTASPQKRSAIKKKIIKLLKPYSDNPAYTALLESKGIN